MGTVAALTWHTPIPVARVVHEAICGGHMKNRKRKLGLRKETLRALVLDDGQLARVAGGSILCSTDRNEDGLPDMSGTAASLSGSRKC